MVRGVLVEAIFNKTMRISITALNNSQAVSLMSTDVQRIVDGLKYIHEIWANVIQIAVATYLLEGELGYACVGPVSVAIGSSFRDPTFSITRLINNNSLYWSHGFLGWYRRTSSSVVDEVSREESR